MDKHEEISRVFARIEKLREESKLPPIDPSTWDEEPCALAFTPDDKFYFSDEKLYTEDDMLAFSEFVSLNFPNQHNYLRSLQKYNQGLDVPKEHLVGYRSTKELLEKFNKK